MPTQIKEQSNDRLYVITGGPGTGKTKLLDELISRGSACVPEAARDIIQQEMRNGGDAVPWKNMQRYSELMLKKSIEDYLAYANAQQVTIFDRGILDTFAHYRLAQLTLPEDSYAHAQLLRYNRNVFLTPPWEEIYETDSERKQTYAESVAVYQTIKDVYVEYGYNLIEIPRTSISERADFVMQALRS
ncbi:AAA family ATPase [Acidobacterium sp. S8]|uniref:AAA family ATPase n=1 Tax=Acidobacterium sp. S8 TaxID=1641854 RepID=UPI00131D13EF|nr:AAA family ATPase [Acidobacterium sp. S8]